jgi:hypothetical protein
MHGIQIRVIIAICTRPVPSDGDTTPALPQTNAAPRSALVIANMSDIARTTVRPGSDTLNTRTIKSPVERMDFPVHIPAARE